MKKYLIFCMAFFFLTVTSFAEDEKDLNFIAKFVANLGSYIEFPAGKSTDANGNLAIAVVGNTPLTSKISENAKNENVSNLTVKEVTYDDDLSGFQIVIITTQDKNELPKVLKQVSGKPIFTIANASYFANHGVMLNFFKEDGSDKVKFEVNKMVVDDSGISISSKLLKMAKLI